MVSPLAEGHQTFHILQYSIHFNTVLLSFYEKISHAIGCVHAGWCRVLLPSNCTFSLCTHPKYDQEYLVLFSTVSTQKNFSHEKPLWFKAGSQEVEHVKITRHSESRRHKPAWEGKVYLCLLCMYSTKTFWWFIVNCISCIVQY